MIIQLQKDGTFSIIRAGAILITGCDISIAILLAMAVKASGDGMADKDIPFLGEPMAPRVITESDSYF